MPLQYPRSYPSPAGDVIIHQFTQDYYGGRRCYHAVVTGAADEFPGKAATVLGRDTRAGGVTHIWYVPDDEETR